MKVFVISDIHSHYEDMIRALNQKGFKQNWDEHLLVLNGDGFDRGNMSREVKDFLDSTNNKICVIGNHELLLLDAINRGLFLSHDLSNGTLDAAIQLTGGYDSYPEFNGINKAEEFFNKLTDYFLDYPNQLSHKEIQKKIVKNLIDRNIVEWIVANFFINGRVNWNEERNRFTITGKPRYYLQIEDKLIMHGFFPAPDWVKTYTSRTSGHVFHAALPDDFDILEESTRDMWEEPNCGVWSNTPYWLKSFYKYKLDKLYAYIVKKNIKHIYIGHWTKRELENMVVSVSMTPTYEEYHDKMPDWHFTDGEVVTTHEVIVETFETK